MEQSSGKNQESSAVKPDDDWSDLASEKPKKSQVKGNTKLMTRQFVYLA